MEKPLNQARNNQLSSGEVVSNLDDVDKNGAVNGLDLNQIRARQGTRSLRSFMASPMSQINIEDLSTPDLVFQIGVAPQRIDILTSVSGVEFEEAWPNRFVANLDGLLANVIGREELLRNKLASGRPKDLLDANILQSGT